VRGILTIDDNSNKTFNIENALCLTYGKGFFVTCRKQSVINNNFNNNHLLSNLNFLSCQNDLKYSPSNSHPSYTPSSMLQCKRLSTQESLASCHVKSKATTTQQPHLCITSQSCNQQLGLRLFCLSLHRRLLRTNWFCHR